LYITYKIVRRNCIPVLVNSCQTSMIVAFCVLGLTIELVGNLDIVNISWRPGLFYCTYVSAESIHYLLITSTLSSLTIFQGPSVPVAWTQPFPPFPNHIPYCVCYTWRVR
jgi:hypothetical protein